MVADATCHFDEPARRRGYPCGLRMHLGNERLHPVQIDDVNLITGILSDILHHR